MSEHSPATPGKEDREHSPPEAPAPPGSLCKAGLCLLAAVAAHQGVTSSPLLLAAQPILLLSPLMQIESLTGKHICILYSVQVSPGAGHRIGALGAQLSSSPFPKNSYFKSLLFYEVTSGTLQSAVKLI